MRKSLKLFPLVLSLILCLAASAFGQETTGQIQGTVKDQSGAVVPNVTITIKGVNVGFNRTLQTDQEGFYRANQVPPGTYTVTMAAASGFTEQTINDVNVALGNATTVDITAAASVAGTVNVTGEGGVIVDPTETKAQTNITTAQIDNLPKGTGFSSLLRISPAVRPEPLGGQFTINGSTGPENSFIIDGQEVQNYKNGLLNTNNDIPYQSLQEIQIKTSGFEAEFGGATGGVINAVTKSGSNDFRGEFGINFTPSKFSAGRRPVLSNQLVATAANVNTTQQVFEYFPQARDGGTNEYPTALLSGPIIKDKFWFFAIHSPRFVNTKRTTTYLTAGDDTTRTVRGVETVTEKTTYNYSALRLDAAPFNSLRLSSSFTWNPIVDQSPVLGNSYAIASVPQANLGYGLLRGAELASVQGGRQNSNNFRAEGIWVPTSKAVVDLRYTRGFLNQKLGSYGIFLGPRIICQSVPAAFAAQAGCTQGFSSVPTNDVIKRDVSVRTTYDASLSYLVSSFMGRHEFKGGFQRSKIFNDVETGAVGAGRSYLYYGRTTFNCQNVYVQWEIQCGNNYQVPVLPAGVTVVGTGVNYQFGAFGQATNTANTFYIQDKWQPTSRLTLNLGLRMEQEEIPAFNTQHIDLKFPYSDKLGPRIGAAYALTSDGKTKISGFYGRFFDRLKFSLPQGSFGGNFYHVSYFYITSDHPASFYTVPNLRGAFTFPNGGQCPIALAGPNSYVCDQDYRIASNIPGADVLTNGAVDPNIKPYRQSEATFEFQRELMRGTILTARYLWRNLDETIEDAGVPTPAGEAYVIGNPGKGLAAQVYQQLGYNKAAVPIRKYRAFQVEMDTRYVKNLSLNLNYTWSRLTGNYSGLANPDEQNTLGVGRLDPNVSRGFDEPWVGFTASGQPDIGILPLDRTHAFKASGTYSYDWMRSRSNTTDISFFTVAESGTPLTTFVNIFGIPITETKRGDLGRMPMFTQTDLNLTHRIRFGNDGRFTFAIDLNVLNLFNENNIIAVNQNKSSGYFALGEGDVVANASTRDATNVLTSQGVLQQYAAAEQAFGIGFARNLAFNQPISWQDPRVVRFGFRFLF